MKVAVWDTYVSRDEQLDKMMHFDILVPEELQDPAVIRKFGEEYLNEKTFQHGKINTD